MKPKGPTWEQTRGADVEARRYESYGLTPRMGRSSIMIECPFCDAHVEAYLWSIAGGGKRCTCGALFGSFGVAHQFYPQKPGECTERHRPGHQCNECGTVADRAFWKGSAS